MFVPQHEQMVGHQGNAHCRPLMRLLIAYAVMVHTIHTRK